MTTWTTTMLATLRANSHLDKYALGLKLGVHPDAVDKAARRYGIEIAKRRHRVSADARDAILFLHNFGVTKGEITHLIGVNIHTVKKVIGDSEMAVDLGPGRRRRMAA